MENKKKPSTLFLAPDHNHLDDSRTEFTEEMLTWPIVRHNIVLFFSEDPAEELEKLDDVTVAIMRSVFIALSNFSPFTAVVSCMVDTERKILMRSRRTWGKIYLPEDILSTESVITFSHHSHKDNYPYVHIEDWVENLHGITTNPDHLFSRQQREISESLAAWGPDGWSMFFKERIKDRAVHLKKKAQNKIKDANSLNSSAELLLANLC